MESDDLIVLDGDNEDLSPQVVSRRVIDGDYILKKKNSKGSRAWERFRAVLNPSNNDEVYAIRTCVSIGGVRDRDTLIEQSANYSNRTFIGNM